MIYKLLRLRLLQLHRLLSATGYFFVLVALTVIAGVMIKALAGLMQLPIVSVVPIVLMALGTFHFTRKDLPFIDEIATSDLASRQYVIVEYVILLSPLIGYQLIRQQWWVVIGLLLVPVILSFLKSSKDLVKWKSRPLPLVMIPVAAFELRIMSERYIVIVGILWLISFCGMIHPAFLLVSVLLFLFFIIEAYTFNEPLEMIPASRNFIIEKFGLHIGVLSLLFGFQFLISGYFHPSAVMILLVGYAYLCIIIALAITSKYANYHPLKTRGMNSTSLIVAMILGLLPGLILGSLFLAIYYYFKAKKNIAYHVS